MRKAAIVIVNWNTSTLLQKCLASLQGLPEQASLERIYVVDNASSDTSFVNAQKQFSSWSKVTFIPLPKNVGFAAANNIALEKIPSSCDVLLLNPDTEMKPGSLTVILDTLDTNPRAGIVGPRLVNPDKTLQHSIRSFPTFWVLATFLLKLQSLAAKLKFLDAYLLPGFNYDKTQSVDQVMGACFLIRADVLREIRLLDDNFFVWFEEVDYCKRAINGNWQVLYTPNTEVIHYGGVSFNQVVGLKKALPLTKSVLHYARKHLSLFSYVALVLLTPLSLILTIPASIRHAVLRRRNEKRL